MYLFWFQVQSSWRKITQPLCRRKTKINNLEENVLMSACLIQPLYISSALFLRNAVLYLRCICLTMIVTSNKTERLSVSLQWIASIEVIKILLLYDWLMSNECLIVCPKLFSCKQLSLVVNKSGQRTAKLAIF